MKVKFECINKNVDGKMSHMMAAEMINKILKF